MGKKKRRKKEICPNCKVGLNSNANFCSNCGQENHQKRATVKMLVNDFSQDYFTFDSKLFRSLKPLLFNPGFLTLEFIKGKRMNYIKPIRLYLFISFIYFLTHSIVSLNQMDDELNETETSNEIVLFEYNEKQDMSEKENEKGFIHFEYNKEKEKSEEEIENERKELIKKIEFSKKTRNGIAEVLYKQQLKLISNKGKKKLDDSLKRNTPIFLFITIPMLAFILFMLFYRKGRFYVDHLIFALHYQSFIFLFLLFFAIAHQIFLPHSGYIKLFKFITIALYGVIAVKRSYNVTYIGGFLRLLGATSLHVIGTALLYVFYLWFTIFLI